MAGKKAWGGGDPAGQSSIPYARAAARIPRARAGSDENIGKTNMIACRVRPKKFHGGPKNPWGGDPSLDVGGIQSQSQSQSQFIKDKRLHVNTRNIQRQLYPCTATEEVD